MINFGDTESRYFIWLLFIWQLPLLSFYLAASAAGFLSGSFRCSVSIWQLPLLSFYLAASAAGFLSGSFRCRASVLRRRKLFLIVSLARDDKG
jgi:hypothetical protein